MRSCELVRFSVADNSCEELNMGQFVVALAMACAAGILFSPVSIAAAGEIKVLSTTVMKTTLDELAPEFERATGHKTVVAYAPAARIAKRIADGEANDLAIVTRQGLEELIKQGKIVAGSQTDLARAVAGLAVQKGAPRPDISSVEKFKKALLAARSIAISSGQTGNHLIKIFDELGMSQSLKPKLIIGRGGPNDLIGDYVVRGEAELGIHEIAALMAVPAIDIVGPLPRQIQLDTVFAAGLSTSAKDPDAGRALLKFLLTSDGITVMKAKGLDPA